MIMSTARILTVPLVATSLPDKMIKLSDCPLPQADAKKIKTLDPHKFAASIGMKQWCELSLIAMQGAKPLSFKCLSHAEALTMETMLEVAAWSRMFSERMAICKINDKVGYGVFATDEIPKGAFVGIYTGAISNKTQKEIEQATAPYAFAVKPKEEKGLGVSLDAIEYGNITRFFQHLPLEEEREDRLDQLITDFEFKKPEQAREVATANLQQCMVTYYGIPVNVFQTIRAIHKNEQLGFSYGLEYWISCANCPSLFNKKGDVIPADEYVINRIAEIVIENDSERIAVHTKALTNEMLEQYANTGFVLPVGIDTEETFVRADVLRSAMDKCKDTPQFLRIDVNNKKSSLLQAPSLFADAAASAVKKEESSKEQVGYRAPRSDR